MELFDPDDLHEARADAESLMFDRCVVDRPGVAVTGLDGTVTVPLVRVYPTPADVAAGKPGVCKVQSSVAQAAAPTAGGHRFTVEALQVHFPVAAPPVTGDVVTITEALLDPTLVGLQFRLVELARGTARTAARWNVELVTA